MKLHLRNCNEHPNENNPCLPCWAIGDESGRRVPPNELIVLLSSSQEREASLSRDLSLLQEEVTHCHEYLDSVGVAEGNPNTLLGRIQMSMTGKSWDRVPCSWCGSRSEWSADRERVVCANPFCDSHKDR